MAEKFTDRFRDFLKGNDDYDDDDYYEEDTKEDLEIPISRAAVSGQRIVSMNAPAPAIQKVVIYEPDNYEEDAPKIVDNICQGKVCIVNLERITDPDMSKTIFDFLNGAIYAIDGNIRKVSKGIFILANKNVDIDGNFKKEMENKGFFKW